VWFVVFVSSSLSSVVGFVVVRIGEQGRGGGESIEEFQSYTESSK
jgi:hypothetical protein